MAGETGGGTGCPAPGSLERAGSVLRGMCAHTPASSSPRASQQDSRRREGARGAKNGKIVGFHAARRAAVGCCPSRTGGCSRCRARWDVKVVLRCRPGAAAPLGASLHGGPAAACQPDRRRKALWGRRSGSGVRAAFQAHGVASGLCSRSALCRGIPRPTTMRQQAASKGRAVPHLGCSCA